MTAMSITLAAAAIITLALAIAYSAAMRFVREMTTSHAAQLHQATSKFIRQLDGEARQVANTTDDPFATTVLHRIEDHMKHLDALKDANIAKARKRFK